MMNLTQASSPCAISRAARSKPCMQTSCPTSFSATNHMRRITFDIETEGDFNSNGDFSNLGVTVVGIYDSETEQLSSYLKEDLPQLWPILEKADILVGYNSEHFDIP